MFFCVKLNIYTQRKTIMKTSLKSLVLVITLTVLTTSGLKAKPLDFSSLVNEFMNEQNTLKKIVNLSGKQRMLTQNMSKLTILISLNVKKEQNIETLKKLSSLYNSTLMAFKNGDSEMGIPKATNEKVVEQILEVEKAWVVFYGHVQKIIDGSDTGSSFDYIMKNNENLLKISNELVKRYEDSNTSDNYLEKARLRVVNVAGRQRMLTQKMTKEKLLLHKGNQEVRPSLLKTVTLFDESLSALIKGDTEKMITKATNEKIIEQLKVVHELWTKLKPLYEKEKNTTKELAFIIAKNTVLLKEMNTMVQLSEVEVEY